MRDFLGRGRRWAVALGLGWCVAQGSALAAENAYEAPPPMRPLAVASDRPMESGPALFVDGAKGSDNGPGTEKAPFKTLKHALTRLKPGTTLYLRGGTYYEQVDVCVQGEPGKPITIRAYPKELVVIDGGLREFLESPQSAWEPCPGGGEGEFWSTKTYEPQGETRPEGNPGGVNIQGFFADTMVPMQGYWSLFDLRSKNEYWNLESKSKDGRRDRDTGNAAANDNNSIYCGPGILYDPSTKRIHARLAHTTLAALGEDNYRGQTDPRKLRLAISRPGEGSVMEIKESSHLRLQDLVFRGSRGATLRMEDCQDIDLDGLTVYAGQNCVTVSYTRGLRAINCAFRGISAPWTFRSSLKYRAIESRIFSASGWHPMGNADFELSYCEFSDSVDGIFIGNVRNVDFHHNAVENISDDVFFLTAHTAYDGTTPGGNIRIHENYIARGMTIFAFGVGHGRQKTVPTGKQLGAGAWVYRNVFDNRQWVPYFPPRGPEETTFAPVGRMVGDHGSPVWESMNFYQNTLIMGQDGARGGYLAGLGNAVGNGNQRRVFNNILVQVKGLPGTVVPDASKADLQADANLHWSDLEGAKFKGDFFAKFRGSRFYEPSKKVYPPGWMAQDRFGDPLFASFSGDPAKGLDLRLKPESPAIDTGVAIPAAWPDPLRGKDQGKPDLGALPAGAEPWTVGVGGRMTIWGKAK